MNFGSIQDGSSNTLMYGEASVFAQEYNPVINAELWQLAHSHYGFWVASGWPNMRTFTEAGIVPDTAQPLSYPGASTDEAGGIDYRAEQSFGSPHPGSCNFVLGDGSTHSVSQDTNWEVLNRLGMRNDGFVININDL